MSAAKPESHSFVATPHFNATTSVAGFEHLSAGAYSLLLRCPLICQLACDFILHMSSLRMARAQVVDWPRVGDSNIGFAQVSVFRRGLSRAVAVVVNCVDLKQSVVEGSPSTYDNELE